jgi:hypothetical protein
LHLIASFKSPPPGMQLFRPDLIASPVAGLRPIRRTLLTQDAET